MTKRLLLVLIFAAIIVSSGCTAILEGDTADEDRHIAVVRERPQEERIRVSGYEELKAAMLELIMEHETNGLMVIYTYDGDVQKDVDRAIRELMNSDPRVVYAVAEVTGNVTLIVSYFEVEIEIEYKHTKEQVDALVAVPTLRSLRTELLSILSEYREEAVLLTSLKIEEDYVIELIKETYYQNPRTIVMIPVTAVTTIEAGGENRFIEMSFRYMEPEGILRQLGASLSRSVRTNALAAEGENDGKILLSLVENLAGACIYDENTARTISEYGAQNIAVTAYSALVRGSAVGEGFAMAFKALCDELDFECSVVLGDLNGMVHAWNIISLYGEHYHIDAAMCALNGVDTAFLKTDEDLLDKYSWDMVNSVMCNGSLTYQDIVAAEEGEENGETHEKADNEDAGETEEQTLEAMGQAGEIVVETSGGADDRE